MSNRVDIALLCEDGSHEQFIKKFLRLKHRNYRRVFPSAYKSGGAGGVQSNNAFVLHRAPIEIAVARKVPPRRALIVVIDGDNSSHAGRCGEIDRKLREQKKEALNDKERIALVIPCCNIETWIHHFAGNPTDEKQDFKSLHRNFKTTPQAQAFADWVSDGNADEVADLPALNAARVELRRLHELMK